LRSESLGVVIGSAIGEITDSACYLEKVFTRGPAAASPLLFPNLVLNEPASYVATELGTMGINFTVAQNEVSGEEAILQGCPAIRAGRAEAVLAGGGDELSSIVAEICFRTGRLSGQRGGPQWCSPYDRDHNGMVLGEGAAVLALESPARARARNAPILALIEGEKSFSVPAPLYDWPLDATAACGSIRPLVGAGVDLVVSSANSTPRLDDCEAALFSRLLAAGDDGAVITSIKGAVGEFGGAGALSVAAACLALHDQVVPPLCRLRTPASASLRFAGREGRSAPLRRALVCGLARGGAGTALALRKA
jgi:3-oxoacyl-[acyl-carrier-protein] synthase II